MEFAIIAVLIGILMVFSGLFSAVETALFSLQPVQIRRFKRERPVLGALIEGLLENPRRLLSALSLADMLVNVPLILLCLMVLRDITRYGIPFWVSSLVIFAVVVIFCDLLPKMIALRVPFKIAGGGARLLSLLLPVLDPVCRFLQRASDKVADLLTPKAFEKPGKTLEEGELEMLVQISAEEGALQLTESAIIQEVIKLGSKSARDCMTPRIDVFSIPDDLTNEQALSRLRYKRFPRVPVYADTPDNILGVLDVQRFLLNPEVHYTEHLTPPSFVPETMKALALLKSFLTHPQRLAVVVDEYGGTEGIVTLPDIIEQIISDAVPSSLQELYIENFGAGRLVVAGSARLDDLSERLNVDFEQEGIETIGGLIFNQLGYLPKPGESCELNGLRFIVRRATRKRIHEILIEPKNYKPFTDTQEDGEVSGVAS